MNYAYFHAVSTFFCVQLLLLDCGMQYLISVCKMSININITCSKTSYTYMPTEQLQTVFLDGAPVESSMQELGEDVCLPPVHHVHHLNFLQLAGCSHAGTIGQLSAICLPGMKFVWISCASVTTCFCNNGQ